MDENRTKEQIHSHAEAVERGDFDAVIADFTEELQAQAPQIAQTLPQPVTSANGPQRRLSVTTRPSR